MFSLFKPTQWSLHLSLWGPGTVTWSQSRSFFLFFWKDTGWHWDQSSNLSERLLIVISETSNLRGPSQSSQALAYLEIRGLARLTSHLVTLRSLHHQDVLACVCIPSLERLPLSLPFYKVFPLISKFPQRRVLFPFSCTFFLRGVSRLLSISCWFPNWYLQVGFHLCLDVQ